MDSGWLRTLNDNAGAIQVIFSALVTAATIVYALLTWRLVSETRRMRRAQTDARMTVTVESRPEYLNFVDLRVRNQGLGPAYDVRFKVSVQSEGCDEELLNRIHELGYIKHGLPYFSPNQEIGTFLVSLTDDFESKMKSKINIAISYRTAAGERVRDDYLIDFSSFEGIHQLGTPDLHQIAKSTKELAKDFHDIATGWKKPLLITQDKADYRREQEETHQAALEARAARQDATVSETEEA